MAGLWGALEPPWISLGSTLGVYMGALGSLGRPWRRLVVSPGGLGSQSCGTPANIAAFRPWGLIIWPIGATRIRCVKSSTGKMLQVTTVCVPRQRANRVNIVPSVNVFRTVITLTMERGREVLS